MWRVQNGRIPYLTKKRSFDLAWGAWAGILAVMTAVGAALAGSQMLMMYPRSANMIVLKFPSMPRSDVMNTTQLGSDTLTFFWGAKGLVVGRITEVTAPQGVGRVLVKTAATSDLKTMMPDLESWFRQNLSKPAEVVAVSESLRRAHRLTLNDLAELTHAVEQLNKKVFSQSMRPTIVTVDMMNPI